MNAQKLPNVVYTTGFKKSVSDMQTLSYKSKVDNG